MNTHNRVSQLLDPKRWLWNILRELLARIQAPLSSFFELSNYIEEFFTGITHDANMVNLLKHYEAHPESFNQETNFFEAANLEQEHKVS